MTDVECEICGENFTKERRKTTECRFCNKVCCLSCFKEYLIKSENITPKCMFCSENLSYLEIRNLCSFNFCNKVLHEKRTETEMKRQLSLLPATQHLANLEMERKKYFMEIGLYDRRIEELKREIRIINNQKRAVPWPTMADVQTEENKITFIQKCPIEGCNGFLNSSWKCGICETYICNKCHEPKESRRDENHVCDEATVSTITEIKRESKPCPKCATYIFKIDGCDQMWCPECKTPFSWKTGRIESGSIHNPHYYEYMRKINNGQIPRQPGDIPHCEMVPDFHSLWNSMNIWKRKHTDNKLSVRVNNFFRNRIHFNRVQIQRIDIDYQLEYTKLRVRYLLKEIDDKIFKDRIGKLLRREERDSETLKIYNLFFEISGEILKNINELLRKGEVPDKIIEELERCDGVIKFCNEKIEILSTQFKNSIKLIKF